MASQGRSLHLGVNRVDAAAYPRSPTALRAAEADAEAMAALVVGAGLDATTILGTRATRAAVTEALLTAVAALRSGDLFVLTFAGHSAQFVDDSAPRPLLAPNLDLGDEDDGRDESWCLHDGVVLDDELHDYLARFRAGVRIFVLVDSCHSGTGLRDRTAGPEAPTDAPDPTDVVRGMSEIDAEPAYDRARAAYAASGAEAGSVEASVLVISACRDSQIATERGGHGRFTAAVIAAWGNGTFSDDHPGFRDAIATRTPSHQTPMLSALGRPDAAFLAQRPFMVAAPIAHDRLFGPRASDVSVPRGSMPPIQYTYFICGVRVSTPTSLTIRVRTDTHVAGGRPPIPPPDPLPSLRVITRGAAEPTSVAAKDGQWSVPTLGLGDHVLRIDHEDYATWPGLEIAPGWPPDLVLVTERALGTISGWPAAVARKSDPKDPWPPPVAEQVTDDDWFTATFDAKKIVRPKG